MRQILLGSCKVLVVALASLVLFGGVGAQAATEVGAEVSVPAAPDFGLGVNFGNPSGWYNTGLASIAARAGANTFRAKMPEYYYARWGYDIDNTNGNMPAYRSNGLTNLVGHLIGPSAAHSTSPTGGSLDQYSPKNLYQPIWSSTGVVNPNNYWASYVYNVVTRYKSQVKIWEVWNEPDVASNWNLTQTTWWTSPPKASELPNWHDSIYAYIRMLRVTYEVAKYVDPNCFVAVGGLGYESFLDAILRYSDNPSDGSVNSTYPAKGGAWFDAVSYHHYPQFATYDQASTTWLRGTDSDAMATGFIARQNTMRIQLEDHGFNGSTHPRKLWVVTETGVSSKAIGSSPGGSELQHNYILKMAIAAMANGISHVDWFQLGDTEADSSSSSLYAHMGLYYALAGQSTSTAKLKPSAAAYQTVASFLRGQKFDAASTAALSLPDGVEGYVFRASDGDRTYAVWAKTSGNRETGSATVQLPASGNVEQRDWDFGSTRAVKTLSSSGGSVTVNLSTSPTFITMNSGATTPFTPTPTTDPGQSTTPTATVVPPTATPTKTAVPTATPSPTQTSGPATERLVNGGFENALNSWYIPSWFSGVIGADGTATHGGSTAVRFDGSSKGAYLHQEVAANAGDTATFSGWLNVAQLDGNTSVEVDLVPRHQYNGDISTISLTCNTAVTNGWVRISGSAVMPDRTVAVRLKVEAPSLNGTVYLDDLSLVVGSGVGTSPTAPPTATAPAATATATPTATAKPSATPTATVAPTQTTPASGELLKNGGFESGLAEWYYPSWFAGTICADGTLPYGGAKSLQFKGNVAGPYTYQEVTASPGQTFNFSGMINITEEYSDFGMIVELVARTSSNGTLATFPIIATSSKTSGWTKISGTAVMPDRTAILRVQVRFPKLYGTVYLDNLSLKEN